MPVVSVDQLNDGEKRSLSAAIQYFRRRRPEVTSIGSSEPARDDDGRLCQVHFYSTDPKRRLSTVYIDKNGNPSGMDLR